MRKDRKGQSRRTVLAGATALGAASLAAPRVMAQAPSPPAQDRQAAASRANWP